MAGQRRSSSRIGAWPLRQDVATGLEAWGKSGVSGVRTGGDIVLSTPALRIRAHGGCAGSQLVVLQ